MITKIFNTVVGDETWIVPTNVTTINAEVLAAGGDGTGGDDTPQGGTGGGSGGYASIANIHVMPGDVITVTRDTSGTWIYNGGVCILLASLQADFYSDYPDIFTRSGDDGELGDTNKGGGGRAEDDSIQDNGGTLDLNGGNGLNWGDGGGGGGPTTSGTSQGGSGKLGYAVITYTPSIPKQHFNFIWDIYHRLTGFVQTRTLYLLFNEKSGNIANDSAGYGQEYDADYVGGVGDSKWQGSSVALTNDYFHVPAAPFNFCGDFSLSVWVKSDQTDFTILSCKRDTENALELTNKRITVNGTSYIFAS